MEKKALALDNGRGLRPFLGKCLLILCLEIILFRERGMSVAGGNIDAECRHKSSGENEIDSNISMI
jgi:hypothetical protein